MCDLLKLTCSNPDSIWLKNIDIEENDWFWIAVSFALELLSPIYSTSSQQVKTFFVDNCNERKIKKRRISIITENYAVTNEYFLLAVSPIVVVISTMPNGGRNGHLLLSKWPTLAVEMGVEHLHLAVEVGT
jgi:hypothetical protein